VAPPVVLIWNSYDGASDGSYFPVDLFVVNTSVSGWAPLTGDTAVGAVTFKVEPSAAAPAEGSVAAEGLTGVSGDFEQASARANKAAAEQRARVLSFINTYLGWIGREL
jgi:hypothetical protein